ncbi:MAG: sensor histidine kinase [Desulfonatronovibrio sp.]
MQVEIKKDISLPAGNKTLLDMHSLYNVLNILTGELQILEMMVQDEEEELKENIRKGLKIKDNLSDTDKIVAFAANIDDYLISIQKTVSDLFTRYPWLAQNSDSLESRENINSVLHILKVRAGEILERYKEPGNWKNHNLRNLTRNFMDVFVAIEKNSKGRYRFVYNPAAQEQEDYYIDLRFESIDGPVINMPPVFQDVMRDLMANARKYTDPGGRISAGLLDDGRDLRFCVADSGLGIPSSEIERVINFGYRASNVADRRTMGGGFGLTKAYLVTRQHNGRMWIDSEQNLGTRVFIIIPRP